MTTDGTVTATLGQWAALTEAATEGPWEADGTEITQHWSRPEPWLSIASDEVACTAYCYGGSARGIESEADAEFIAAARTAMPVLLGFVREVQALADWHETKAHKARTFPGKGHEAEMEKAARVHEDAAQRIRALTKRIGGEGDA